MDDKPAGKRTETVVREYDKDGALVKETTSVVTVSTPKADADEHPGMFL